MQPVDIIQYKYDVTKSLAQKIDAEYSSLADRPWFAEGLLLLQIRDDKLWKLLGFRSFPDYYRARSPKIEKEEIHKKIKTAELHLHISMNSSNPPPHNQSLCRHLLFGCRYPLPLKSAAHALKLNYLTEIWGFFVDFCACDLENGGEGDQNLKQFKLFIKEFYLLFDETNSVSEIDDVDDVEEELTIDDIVNVAVDLQKKISLFKKLNKQNAVQIKTAIDPSLSILHNYISDDNQSGVKHD